MSNYFSKRMRSILNRPIVQWVTSGALFGVAFLHPWLWVCYIPAFVLFLEAARLAPTTGRVVAGSWLVGTMKSLGAIAWFWHTYPLTWIEAGSPQFEFLFVGFYWAHVSIALGTGFIMLGLAARWFLHRDARYLFLLPFAVVCAELAGSYIFSLLALGPGISANMSFSFGYLGYLLAYAPGALGFALLGGVYALSCLAGFVGVVVYLIVFRPRISRVVLVTAVAVLTLVWLVTSALLLVREHRVTGIRVAAVATDLTAYELTSQEGDQLHRQIVEQAANAALLQSPNVLVFPEGASFLQLFGTERDAIERTVQAGVGTVVGSTNVRRDDDSVVLRAHVIDATYERIHYVDKRYLVPQGEHMIYYIVGILTLLGRADLVENMAEWALQPGEPREYSNASPQVPSILFCTEGVNPLAVRHLLKERETQLVAHVTSHGWFHRTFLLRPQLDRMLRIQAVWNQAVIVEAGNRSSSKAYMPDGSVTHGELAAEGNEWEVYVYEL